LPSGTIAAPLPAAGAAVYRPRRAARTLLHKVMRENLETYLADGDQTGEFDAHVPFHVETAYRRYLNCGVLAHGFARAYCPGCGHDFLIAFSCNRHGHLDSVAVHTLDAPDHAGGWSVNASVTIPGWDRHGLERLVLYCARPPLSQERLGRLDDQMLVYSLRKATVDGRTELYLTPLELLDRLAQLITPPRIHKHRYCGVLAPNARLRGAVIESAGPAGATLQVLQQAREKMGLPEVDPSDTGPTSGIRRNAARCWALLLARIYECLPLRCPRCGEPMRNIAFILELPVIERVLTHIGEPSAPPSVLPARAPPQVEMGFDPGGDGPEEWPDMDQTAGTGSATWE